MMTNGSEHLHKIQSSVTTKIQSSVTYKIQSSVTVDLMAHRLARTPEGISYSQFHCTSLSKLS